ncbi:DNA phosphorothioation-associated DGQHR protein 1 [Acinetobacter baumannii]|nr:DNA phosphorothioation-associated DGQHR protein 1 [Acinetobacter baumannii]MDV7549465.1 DNA phosphorothioation-associated DGQHR protein 1 [Acinetobacter baumannii]
MTSFPLKFPVLEVKQPMGTFYCTSIPAKYLLEVSFSDSMRAEIDSNGLIKLQGTQRVIKEDRLKQISEYINRTDAAFPNSIILAANYTESGNTLDDLENSDRWEIKREDQGLFLFIPSRKKLAAIIDGQHRLFAFAKADRSRLEMELLCSIYLDLPKPYQAQIFAIINSTQRAVDKSLTYELYGYNINEEDSSIWSPDKLSVFITRKLNLDPESPLRSHIKIAPIMGEELEKSIGKTDWNVSTAVIVEGILKLISTNPRKDSNKLFESRKPNRTDLTHDNSPLRSLYIEQNDGVLYKIVVNFLTACKNIFWNNADGESYILKTIGIQAQFDILKKISHDAVFKDKRISVTYFEERLKRASTINFSDEKFKNASGSGRREIRDAIEIAIGLKEKPE